MQRTFRASSAGKFFYAAVSILLWLVVLGTLSYAVGGRRGEQTAVETILLGAFILAIALLGYAFGQMAINMFRYRLTLDDDGIRICDQINVSPENRRQAIKWAQLASAEMKTIPLRYSPRPAKLELTDREGRVVVVLLDLFSPRDLVDLLQRIRCELDQRLDIDWPTFLEPAQKYALDEVLRMDEAAAS